MGLEVEGSMEKEMEEKKILLCESIGHQPLWVRCPKNREIRRIKKRKGRRLRKAAIFVVILKVEDGWKMRRPRKWGGRKFERGRNETRRG